MERRLKMMCKTGEDGVGNKKSIKESRRKTQENMKLHREIMERKICFTKNHESTYILQDPSIRCLHCKL